MDTVLALNEPNVHLPKEDSEITGSKKTTAREEQCYCATAPLFLPNVPVLSTHGMTRV